MVDTYYFIKLDATLLKNLVNDIFGKLFAVVTTVVREPIENHNYCIGCQSYFFSFYILIFVIVFVVYHSMFIPQLIEVPV